MANDFFSFNKNQFPVVGKVLSAPVRALVDAITNAFDMLPSVAELASGYLRNGQTAGSSTAYTVTVSNVDALTDFQHLSLRWHTANTTTTPTLNVNGLGARAIRRADGTNVTVGEIAAGIADVVYDLANTRWLLVVPDVANVYDAVDTAVAAASAAESSETNAAGSASTATGAASTAVAARDETEVLRDEVQNKADEINSILVLDPVIAVTLSGGKYTIDWSLGRFFDVAVTGTGNLEMTGLSTPKARAIHVTTRNAGAFTIPVIYATGYTLLKENGTSLAITANGINTFDCCLTSGTEIQINKAVNAWVAI